MAGTRALGDDLVRVREVLEGDRAWGAYLLADLEPPHAAHAYWFVSREAPAVVLLYDAFGTPLFTLFGPAENCAPLFEAALGAALAMAQPSAAGGPLRAFVACGLEHLELVEGWAPFAQRASMLRMRLDPARFAYEPAAGEAIVAPLLARDLSALRALYEDGEAAGEAPDFFLPAMLDDGTYAGVWEGRELVAAAGTHVAAPGARAAAIGNVYVRRDRRNTGLGRAVTQWVVRTLLTRDTETIVLNVRQDRAAAVRVYERLGFAVHRPFVEGWVAAPRPAC